MSTKIPLWTINWRKFTPIYCEGIRPTWTLEQLLKYFIKSQPATYFDAACTAIHCYSKKSRSISDCFFLAKTYFPDVKFKEVLEIIENTESYGMYCYTVKKYVLASNFNISHHNDWTEFKTWYGKMINYKKLVKLVLNKNNQTNR